MDVQRKKMLVLAAVVAIILGGSCYSYWEKTTATETTAYAPEGLRPATAQSKAGETAVIYVSGAVNKPGVYRVSSQIRVVEAINQAGGLAAGADVARVNLAQQVKDGMHIYIPITGEKGSTAQGSGQTNRVNVNTADKAALEKLPGIGPALADKILEYRKTNGGFKDLNDIKKVSGIGDAKFNQIKDKIEI